MKKSNEPVPVPAVHPGSPSVPSAPLTEQSVGDMLIYKNNQLIAVNKPSGIPTQPDKTGDLSLLERVELYAKSKILLIHRLDRVASGIVLFAKTPGALKALNQQFQDRAVKKTYLAVVAQRPPENEGTLLHHIQKNGKINVSHAGETSTPDTKPAELRYRIIGESDRYFLLEVDLLTGRNHQIRAQFAAVGCPIKGDVKYGFRRSNEDRAIHLHAWKLTFDHPVSGGRVFLEAPPPDETLWNYFRDQKIIS